MTKPSVASFILGRLREWGVDRVYGYPGDGSNALNLAFHEHGDALPFIQTRHEELAAFAAAGHAKLTRRVGVCMATSGPGAIHLLNGLYDAKLDHAPVVAIVGQQARMSLGAGYQQEVDLQTLFKDVAGFVQTCMHPSQARHLIDRAVRTALAERTVTCVIVPTDVGELPYEDPPREHGAVYSGVGWNPPVVVPRVDDLERAAEVLNAGSRVAMLVGQGARGCVAEVTIIADLLGCGVAKALNGRAALPDDLPWVTGSIGLLGTEPSDWMMQRCDTLLMVGTSFPYSEWLPEPGQARGVQIDIDGRMVGMRYPNEVNLVGDAGATLAALTLLLDRKEDRTWREEIEERVQRWWKVVEARANTPADPINPELVLWELSPRLPDRAIVLADSGSTTNWWARDLRLRAGMDAALSGTLATMGPAIPYALAAKLAQPDRPVIAVLGDGAMQMLGINALMDLAWHHDRWRGRNEELVIVVVNNRDLNQVTWEQRVLAGDAKVPATQDLPAFDYAAYARQLGLEGIRVERPEEIGPALDRALSAGRPAVVDAVCDPEVPPLPPHIRPEQAKNFLRAILHGDPGSARFVRQSIREKLAEVVTRS